MAAREKDAGELYTVLMVGDGGVGKTAVTIMLVENHFIPDYNPTIEDAFTKILRVDGAQCTLKIWDTAGQEEYSALAETHYGRANGFLLVYSVVSRSGFSSIDKFRTRVLQYFDKSQYPMVLVANKVDLVSQRVVTTHEGKDLAKSFGIPYIEVSAKTNMNVEECFFDLVRLMRKYAKSNRSSNKDPNTPPQETSGYYKRKCVIC